MFKFFINFLLFKITIAQIHLTKDNLDQSLQLQSISNSFYHSME